MLDLLIESGVRATARRQLVPGALIAVVAHVAVAAAAIWATLEPAGAARAEPPPVVIAWPEQLGRDRRGRTAEDIPGPPATIVDAPPVPPVGLPAIETGAHLEPCLAVRDAGGTGPAHDAGEAAPADWMSVEEPPALLAGPPPAYPELLRAAGIEGRVVVQVVIDTLGRAERGAAVVESTNRGFDAVALAYVRRAVFRPGRVHARAVRVLIRLPIDFTLSGLR